MFSIVHTLTHIYEGHLESSGNSGISQSQRQDPVHLSYQC